MSVIRARSVMRDARESVAELVAWLTARPAGPLGVIRGVRASR